MPHRSQFAKQFDAIKVGDTQEDKAAQAEEKLASAEYDLFSARNTYRWAVDYGVL